MSKTKQKLDQNTIHRVLKLIRPYTGMVILTLTFALITVVTTLLAPVLSGKAVDMILGPGQVDFADLGKIAIAMAATIACTALAQWLMNVVNNRITFQVVRDMRVPSVTSYYPTSNSLRTVPWSRTTSFSQPIS